MAYRDRLYYESYHNYADFSSPVSYGFLRHRNPDLAGRSQSELILQETRETLDSVLFTLLFCDNCINTGHRVSKEAITPWISTPNQYFVSIDHHRKLLALMRAKECREYNVFLGTNNQTTDHLGSNWTAFRKVVNQVWGFDHNPVSANNKVAGNATVDGAAVANPFGGDDTNTSATGSPPPLKYSDGRSIDVVAGTIPLDEPQQPNASARMAKVETEFKVFEPYVHDHQNPGPDFDSLEVANSNQLRVNIEYNVAPATYDGDMPLFVQVWHPGKQVWVPVPMTPVGSPTGSGPITSRRFVMSGQVDNTEHRLVDLSVQDSGTHQVGIVRVKAGVMANTNFAVKFDMIQVVGVSTLPSCPQLDWDHNGVVNYADIVAYVMDFSTIYPVGSTSAIKIGDELWALDVNGDGSISRSDICAFKTLVNSCAPLTLAEQQQFTAMVSVFATGYKDPDCIQVILGGGSPQDDP